MKAFFNHRIIDFERFSIDSKDRAFFYGDGFFETMLAKKGAVELLKYHWKRINDSCRLLKFDLPAGFTEESIRQNIEKLTILNELNDLSRIKLTIWRNPGGKYEPEGNSFNHLFTCETYYLDPGKKINKSGFCQSVSNSFSSLSSLKTLSALPYVIAGLEKKEKDLDDLIILDTDGNISEMLYSNIFWIKQKSFYTPDLTTGCIKGVMRTYLIDKLKDQNREIREVKEKSSVLMNADYIFSTNAMGIVPITRIEGKTFPIYPQLDKLKP